MDNSNRENKNGQSHKEAMMALEDIREKYVKLPSADIEKFAPVYYPIAIVEMELEEMTFEDFESVQYSVLNLIYIGISDYKVIAETLGLSFNYVFRIIRLLNGYNHVIDNSLTELGIQSITSGKKVIKSQVCQNFQVDALNGTLLKVEQIISEGMLNDRDDTDIKIGHLNYMDGVTVESLINQMAKSNYESFIKQKSGILNANVMAINNVRFLEVKYAKCYMMKVRNHSEPIVFAKRYDSNKKDVKERFSWQPFSLKNEAIRNKYNFEKVIPISTDLAIAYVDNLYKLLIERATKVKLIEEIPMAMGKIYKFEDIGVRVGRTEGVVAPIVSLDEKAFVKYNPWILKYLISIKNDGEYLITNEYLFGFMISLRTHSQEIISLAKLLCVKIDKVGKTVVFNKLRENLIDFQNGKDDMIINAIRIELENI